MATITVRGTGTVHATPDEEVLTIGVEALRSTAAEALDDVAARTTVLVALCAEVGAGEGRVTTAGVSVEEHGEHRDGRWQHRGYKATNRLTVRPGDVSVVGTLLGGAVDRAGASVGGPTWRILPEQPAHAESARLAAREARARAEALAGELGGRPGSVVSVRDARSTPPEPRPMRMAATAADAPLPVEAGELQVVAIVDVEFALEQA